MSKAADLTRTRLEYATPCAVSSMLLLPLQAAAQEPPLETKLTIQQAGQEIGREEFTFRPTRARGLPGSTIIAAARYPATGPTTRLAATLERTPDSALAKFQLDVESNGVVTVILAAGSGARLIVRTVAKGSESGRELPGGPDVVLLDDQVFSLYTPVAELATAVPGQPRARGRRRADRDGRRHHVGDGDGLPPPPPGGLRRGVRRRRRARDGVLGRVRPVPGRSGNDADRVRSVSDEPDVLIVGGSLVGLSTALFLRLHGVSCLAVERHTSTAIHPRAGHFQLRTVEILRSAGLEEQVRRKGEEQYHPNGGINNVESLAGREIASYFANLNAGVEEFSPTVRLFIDQDALEPILRVPGRGARRRASLPGRVHVG